MPVAEQQIIDRVREREFSKCRTAGHAWDKWSNNRTPAFGRLVTWRCTSCTSLREDIVGPPEFGEIPILSRRYIYADGYIAYGRNPKRSRNQWRFTYLTLTDNPAAAPAKPSKRVSKNRKKVSV